ncbi:MAG: SPOR domain-containing protein [Betaproteobacteria bacterium]
MVEPYENEEHETELRGKLMKRLAVAGVMVALLLGVLAFFDYLAAPPEPSAPVFTKPVPVPPKKEVTQPVRPNPEQAEAPKVEGAKQEEKPAPPALPVVEAPPKPEVAAQPAPVVPAENKASGKIQPQRATPAIEPAPATPARNAPRPVPEGTAAPTSPGSPATSPVAPVAQPAQPPQPAAATAPPVAVAQPVAVAPPPLARLLSGYIVQAGVFNNARTAEELHAKLALNGIPSTLEARVQVGPFKTKAEADAVREKMKALGISGILIPPAAGRR